ncbi:hypothetical protein BV20DRAFT_963005 [Pilatotrama ljubarskyi]|nr:hypothetical protein BV20DRAFT_963005 [Pilatotrama ljubarskyi]
MGRISGRGASLVRSISEVVPLIPPCCLAVSVEQSTAAADCHTPITSTLPVQCGFPAGLITTLAPSTPETLYMKKKPSPRNILLSLTLFSHYPPTAPAHRSSLAPLASGSASMQLALAPASSACATVLIFQPYPALTRPGNATHTFITPPSSLYHHLSSASPPLQHTYAHTHSFVAIA